jgi:hypothetical protein
VCISSVKSTLSLLIFLQVPAALFLLLDFVYSTQAPAALD